MSTPQNSGSAGRTDPVMNEANKNPSATFFVPSYSTPESDREHGDEVEAARRELAVQLETGNHAA